MFTPNYKANLPISHLFTTTTPSLPTPSKHGRTLFNIYVSSSRWFGVSLHKNRRNNRLAFSKFGPRFVTIQWIQKGILIFLSWASCHRIKKPKISCWFGDAKISSYFSSSKKTEEDAVLRPNSWTYNFIEVSGHILESSQTCGFCMDFSNRREGLSGVPPFSFTVYGNCGNWPVKTVRGCLSLKEQKSQSKAVEVTVNSKEETCRTRGKVSFSCPGTSGAP
jgi:hypothetical protein